MKIFYLLPIFFIHFYVHGQVLENWQATSNRHASFIEQIKGGTDWDSILKTADTTIMRCYSSDILQTIDLLESPMVNEVDSFFHRICTEWYSIFPYRVSGHLQEELYLLYTEDTTEINRIIERAEGKNLYPQVSQIINSPAHESIPLLMGYLNNHAATRLVVPGWDWDEPSFYISVSDMAMELIEIITWCDFHDNAAFYNRLF